MVSVLVTWVATFVHTTRYVQGGREWAAIYSAACGL